VKRSLILAAAALALYPDLAWGAASCSASATVISFGTINPFGSAVTSNGTITVACSNGQNSATYTIALSTGGSGSYANRQVKNGTQTMNYNLYTTTALSTIWGDGTGGTSTVTGTDTRTTKTFTVYGQITPAPVTPNTYSDSITVTVTY